jgi:RNA polymerase sigma factor (sigma-70 family)
LAEDRELIKKSLSGDGEAFRSLVNRYKRLVVRIVHRMVPNETDAEDVYQEVFTRVYQALPRFRLESKMSTWIGRIAYNTCLNHLSKRREVLFEDLRTEGNAGRIEEALLKSHSLPDRQVERTELVELLETEMERMPAQLRTILTLYHSEELSYREIGEIMDLPEGTVKSYLFRARKYLRLRLISAYGEDSLWP